VFGQVRMTVRSSMSARGVTDFNTRMKLECSFDQRGRNHGTWLIAAPLVKGLAHLRRIEENLQNTYYGGTTVFPECPILK
jgi:hypothetical protein